MKAIGYLLWFPISLVEIFVLFIAVKRLDDKPTMHLEGLPPEARRRAWTLHSVYSVTFSQTRLIQTGELGTPPIWAVLLF
jgi:hypothetical protein